MPAAAAFLTPTEKSVRIIREQVSDRTPDLFANFANTRRCYSAFLVTLQR